MENSLQTTELSEYQNYLIAKGYSSKTTDMMMKSLGYFLLWIEQQNIEIETINYNDVTAYISSLDKKEISKSTQSKYLNSIKQYLNYLVISEQIPYNPIIALKLKNTKHKALHSVLSPEELQQLYKQFDTERKKHLIAPPQYVNDLARKRNKIIVGLLVYQGLRTQDISSLELKDVLLREGKIHIPSARRKEERTLNLESHQIFELSDYIHDTRKALLKQANITSDKLFTSANGSENMTNVFSKLLESLKKQQPKLNNMAQIRASVISHWLKLYNKRKVQQMAGHRYVSSTEQYEQLNVDDLKLEVEKYYPDL
jgi:site-specific recombinase XerD